VKTVVKIEDLKKSLGGNTWWWAIGHERMKVGGGVTYNHTTLTD